MVAPQFPTFWIPGQRRLLGGERGTGVRQLHIFRSLAKPGRAQPSRAAAAAFLQQAGPKLSARTATQAGRPKQKPGPRKQRLLETCVREARACGLLPKVPERTPTLWLGIGLLGRDGSASRSHKSVSTPTTRPRCACRMCRPLQRSLGLGLPPASGVWRRIAPASQGSLGGSRLRSRVCWASP